MDQSSGPPQTSDEFCTVECRGRFVDKAPWFKVLTIADVLWIVHVFLIIYIMSAECSRKIKRRSTLLLILCSMLCLRFCGWEINGETCLWNSLERISFWTIRWRSLMEKDTLRCPHCTEDPLCQGLNTLRSSVSFHFQLCRFQFTVMVYSVLAIAVSFIFKPCVPNLKFYSCSTFYFFIYVGLFRFLIILCFILTTRLYACHVCLD